MALRANIREKSPLVIVRGEYFGHPVCANCHTFAVVAGLRAGHPRPAAEKEDVDARNESAHDELPLVNMLSARALSEREIFYDNPALFAG
jgi:hypothetical protein